MDLMSYLVTPVQRIPRYVLLLRVSLCRAIFSAAKLAC